MNCISCGHPLPPSVDPTERYIVCTGCGAKNDLAGVEEHTQAVVKSAARPASRRSRRMNLVGSTLGGELYRVDAKIGGGGMANVYLATQLRLDRKVAVKVLPDELTEDPSFVERFKREATVLAKFSHANIVPVFDTGEEEGVYYIVMGYIEGAGGKASTLRDLIDAKPLEVDHAVRIMQQCLSALQYAHEKSIIHRDIKPGNILIDAQGNAHLADFGIASSRGTVGDHTLTVSGSTLGTARYMAPEQGESASHADARSDLYSLGLVFYEMLVGYVPEAKTFLPGDLLTTKKQSKQFVLPSTFKPGQIDERLDQIVLRAIQPDPADRFQSAKEAMAALAEAVGGSSGGLARRKPAKQQRNRLLRLTAAAVVLAMVAFVGKYYLTLRGRIPAELLVALKNRENDRVVSLVDKNHEWVNRSDVDGLTPLHWAAAQNLPEAAHELLKLGAKLEAQDLKGRTPLHHAAANNCAALVVLLLDKEARQEATDHATKTPQQLAEENKCNDVLFVFERSKLIRAMRDHTFTEIDSLVTKSLAMNGSKEGWTALHYAAYKGDEYTTGKLLDNNAKADAQTTQMYKEPGSEVSYDAGCTPLLLAAKYSKELGGKYEVVVGQLLDKKASPDLADGNGQTPLHYAAKNDDDGIARLLLAKKANPNKQTKKEGLTPLHMAAKEGSLKVLKLLLGDEVTNAALLDANGRTALDWATEAGYAKVVEALLKRKELTADAVVAARNKAKDNKHADIVALFDRWWSDKVFAAIDSDAPGRDWAKLLADAGPAAVAIANEEGDTPLMKAAKKGKSEAFAALLKSKADDKELDEVGPKLLNAAIDGGYVETVEVLLSRREKLADGNPAARPKPLEIAAGRHDPNMIKTLLHHHAKVDAKTLDVAAAPTTRPTGQGDDTMVILGTAFLTDALRDPQASSQSVSDVLSKLDELKLELLDKPLEKDQLPLQMALRSGSADAKGAVFERVKKKKFLDKQNVAGETALHTAAVLGQTDFVEGFLKAGADYTIKDAAGHTPEEAANAAGHTEAAIVLADARKAGDARMAAERNTAATQRAATQAAAEAERLRMEAARKAEADKQRAEQAAEADRLDKIDKWFKSNCTGEKIKGKEVFLDKTPFYVFKGTGAEILIIDQNKPDMGKNGWCELKDGVFQVFAGSPGAPLPGAPQQRPVARGKLVLKDVDKKTGLETYTWKRENGGDVSLSVEDPKIQIKIPFPFPFPKKK